MNKKIFVYAGIGLFVTAGIAATHVPEGKSEWKNLKVIPKTIGEDQLERIMNRFSKQLGVTCSFCHPDTKPGIFPVRVDFGSEDNPEKLIARKMMRMTNKINKRYFNYQNNYDFESLKTEVISCNTCHRGLTKPSTMRLY